jgi:hypothetical protein
MADASGIGFVSQSLQNLLRSAITDAGPFAGTQIDLRSPKEIRLAGVQLTVVSLWLYRVSRVEDLINAPPVRIAPNRVVQRPLPLNLTYLVTPLAKDTLTEQRLLGLAMQAMHDNALLGADFLAPRRRLFPVKFPVGREFVRRQARSALRRQPIDIACLIAFLVCFVWNGASPLPVEERCRYFVRHLFVAGASDAVIGPSMGRVSNLRRS